MTAALLADAVLAIALLAALGGFLRFIERREQAWTKERRELLTRIQHPQLVPVAPQADRRVPAAPPEPDEIDLVGRVQAGD